MVNVYSDFSKEIKIKELTSRPIVPSVGWFHNLQPSHDLLVHTVIVCSVESLLLSWRSYRCCACSAFRCPASHIPNSWVLQTAAALWGMHNASLLMLLFDTAGREGIVLLSSCSQRVYNVHQISNFILHQNPETHYCSQQNLTYFKLLPNIYINHWVLCISFVLLAEALRKSPQVRLQ